LLKGLGDVVATNWVNNAQRVMPPGNGPPGQKKEGACQMGNRPLPPKEIGMELNPKVNPEPQLEDPNNG